MRIFFFLISSSVKDKALRIIFGGFHPQTMEILCEILNYVLIMYGADPASIHYTGIAYVPPALTEVTLEQPTLLAVTLLQKASQQNFVCD